MLGFSEGEGGSTSRTSVGGQIMDWMTSRLYNLGLASVTQKLIGFMQKEKQHAQGHVPHFIWRGPSTDVVLADWNSASSKRGWARRFFHSLLAWAYGLGAQQQRRFA